MSRCIKNGLKREGESCTLNNNCIYPKCMKHEYLKEEDYYESREVGTRARSDKRCVHCGETIEKGIPHEMHHFYPEFEAYPTHKECSASFIKSLN